jgi:hypothetical protein
VVAITHFRHDKQRILPCTQRVRAVAAASPAFKLKKQANVKHFHSFSPSIAPSPMQYQKSGKNEPQERTPSSDETPPLRSPDGSPYSLQNKAEILSPSWSLKQQNFIEAIEEEARGNEKPWHSNVLIPLQSCKITEQNPSKT